MRDEETRLLFQALSQILANQDDIKKHLGINKCDYEYGWDDNETMKLSKKCSKTANLFSTNDNNSSDYW